MSASATDDLRAHIRKLNNEIGEKVNLIRMHFESAKSNGILGVDDPVSRAFEAKIQSLNIKAVALQSNDFLQSDTSHSRTTLSTLWSYVWDMSGYGTSDAVLQNEVAKRVKSCKRAQNLYEQLKSTTESTTRYSQISKRFPADDKRLTLLDDGSAVVLLYQLNEMTPPADVSAVYMKLSFSSSFDIVNKDVLQPAFEAMEKEIVSLAAIREVQRDDAFRVILDRALGMARMFIIMLNKYYEGALGRGFADFASDRFKAVYMLIRNASSLLRTILKSQKPILDALSRVDLTPLSSVYCRNDPVLMARLFEQQKKFAQELHRQETLKVSNEKIFKLVRLFENFFVSTDTITKAALAVPGNVDASMEAGAGMLLRACDSNSHKRYGCERDIDSLYSSLPGLFKNEEDPLYTLSAHLAISPGKSESLLDAAAELKSMKLFQLTSNKKLNWLAQGSYGEVYTVPFAQADMKVAIKSFKIRTSEHKALKQIVREAIIMSDLDHGNILRVFGYREDSAQDAQTIEVSLVTPFYPDGNLYEYIKKNTVCELVKVKLLRDVACAVEYLHDSKKKHGTVIHGDLRAMNVLIGQGPKSLVCDFGLAVRSDMDEKLWTENNRTNQSWLAYEFFDSRNNRRGEKKRKVPLTVKTDIYALGCICYEVLCEQVPYHDYDYEQTTIKKFLKEPPTVTFPNSYRLEDGYRQLMTRCWYPDPCRRASSTEIVRYLTEFVSFLTPPLI